jgi:hypothetical protein
MDDIRASSQVPHTEAALHADLIATISLASGGPISSLSFAPANDHHGDDEIPFFNSTDAIDVAAVTSFVITDNHILIRGGGMAADLEDSTDSQIAATFDRIRHMLATIAEWKAFNSQEASAKSALTNASVNNALISLKRMVSDKASPPAGHMPKAAAPTGPLAPSTGQLVRASQRQSIKI